MHPNRIVLAAVALWFSGAPCFGQDIETVKRAMRAAMPPSAYCQVMDATGLVCFLKEGDAQVSFVLKGGEIFSTATTPPNAGAELSTKLDKVVLNFAVQLGFSQQEAEACFARMLVAQMQTGGMPPFPVGWEHPTVGSIVNRSISLRCRLWRDGGKRVFETLTRPGGRF